MIIPMKKIPLSVSYHKSLNITTTIARVLLFERALKTDILGRYGGDEIVDAVKNVTCSYIPIIHSK